MGGDVTQITAAFHKVQGPVVITIDPNSPVVLFVRFMFFTLKTLGGEEAAEGELRLKWFP